MKRLIAAFLVCAPVTAGAVGTPEQVAACRSDAWKFCKANIPAALLGSIDGMVACMIANKSKLAPVCRAELDKK